MKPRKPKLNAAQLICDIEDRLIPRLHFTMPERAVYYHLLRHTHLKGDAICRISLARIARGTLLHSATVRTAIQSLAHKGVVRMLYRSKEGHDIRLRLPAEIPECAVPQVPPLPDLEAADFYEDKVLRLTIFRREGGRCFYCRRWLGHRARSIDHVIPRPTDGSPVTAFYNSYRNLVASCPKCNFRKADQSATALLRELYREGKITAAEWKSRLAALKALARGHLKPAFRKTAPPLFAA